MAATGSNSDENIEFLIAMMGGSVDRTEARRVLDKFNGDVDKAADSLLGVGGTPDEPPPLVDAWDTAPNSKALAPYVPPPSSPAHQSARLGTGTEGIIDLTSDTPATAPDWAVVLSDQSNNKASATEAAQNDDINRAIEESLAYVGSVQEIEEELPPEDRIRKDNRPVVLRPQDPKHAHIGLLWQALFFVPQVRMRIAGYRGPVPQLLSASSSDELEVEPPTTGPEGQVWSLVELFGYLELATLSELTGEPTLSRFELKPWGNLSLGEDNKEMLERFAWSIEMALDNGAANISPHWERLFHSRIEANDLTPVERQKTTITNSLDFSVISVNYSDDEGNNDLMGCLSSILFPKQPQGSLNAGLKAGELITEASQVLSIYPVRKEPLPSYSGGKASDRKKFRFPKSFYLDRFMQEDEVLTREISQIEKEGLEKVKQLTQKKQALTHFGNKDTIANLRSAIYYFENVAEEEEPGRKSTVDQMRQKLKSILSKIETEVSLIDQEVLKLKANSSKLFENPKLNKYRYDLRAVLMHDGLYGRKHIYSYVQQDDIWWKTLDHTVTQVSEETVLEDRSGLHLGTGPYLLLYSLAIPEPLKGLARPWPDVVKEGARRDSEAFLTQLPPEIRSKVYNPISPPASPLSNPHSPTREPSHYAMEIGA